jgi:hypothetical protein
MFDNATGTGVITLNRPFDGFLVAGDSVIAVVPTIGAKNWVGNRFSWSGVVQFYGTTLGGVIADNDVSNVNVHTIYDSVNGASVRASGLCYYGAGEMVHHLSRDFLLSFFLRNSVRRPPPRHAMPRRARRYQRHAT